MAFFFEGLFTANPDILGFAVEFLVINKLWPLLTPFLF